MATPTTFAPVVTNPGGTGTNITPTLPSGHAAGDVIEIWVGNTGVTAWSAPAGWTIKQQQASTGTASTGVIGTLLYRKVLPGDSLPLANPVCTLGATVTRGAIAFCKRGADLQGVHTLPEWLAFGAATATSNPIRPPSTTTRSPETLVTHYYAQKAATNAPEPTGYTQVEQIVISGTLVINVSQKDVADQAVVLANQDASPTSGLRWVGMISCTPNPDYPYYRGSASSTIANGTFVTVSPPTGTTASDLNGNADLMIATVEAAGNSIAIVPNTPADWTEITGFSDNTSGNGTTVRKYWAHYTGIGLDRRFNRPTNGELSAYINTYRNTHQTTPIGVVNKRQNASSTTSTWDAITRLATKVTMNVTCVADAVPSFTSPTGWMERMDGLGMTCADQPFNATGSTASASFTLSTASPTLVGLIEIVGHASATAATLVIANSSHGHTAQSLALTQVHELATAASSHNHTAENVVLTQVHSLAIQNASHGHTAESVAVEHTHVLTVQNSSHDHTTENLTLTQVHSLSIASSSHAHTADNLALTQAHELVAANASHAHSADNLSLTQTHVLAIQDSSHSHTAENLLLVVEGDLAIANASHAHTADNLVLTQVHQLAIQNSSHAHSAENVAITASSDLVVQPSSHDHTAQNLTLTQVHVLTVQNSTHGHTAENVVLAAEGTLGIQNGAHGHTSQNVTLTQVHSLVIADSVHGHTAGNVQLTEVYDLTIQSATHGHTVESLVLTQAHNLSVSNASHTHTAQNATLGNENNLLIANSVHGHTARNVSFAFILPKDIYVTESEDRIFDVPAESRVLTMPSEDRILDA